MRAPHRLLVLAVLLVAGTSVAAAEDTAPVRVRLAANEYSLGSADAPLTIVEFTDYQCPFCKLFQAETWPRLKSNYLDTGKVRFIVRDLPLSFHSGARPAAEAAHCAGEQGKFWPMHEALLAMQLSPAGIEQQAKALVPDLKRFHACIAANKYAAAISANADQARAVGFNGTPSFIIGRTTPGLLEGRPLVGTRSYEEFDALLKQALATP
jgi:protein-disulfide isomerase